MQQLYVVLLSVCDRGDRGYDDAEQVCDAAAGEGQVCDIWPAGAEPHKPVPEPAAGAERNEHPDLRCSDKIPELRSPDFLRLLRKLFLRRELLRVMLFS